MADLTSKQRDELPTEHFAVPSERRLPINDATHTRLAWSLLEKTEGLTSEEKAMARSRILHRAKVLGIDTQDWHPVQASIELQAMSLQLPDVAGHPNRLAFNGVLTRVGVASDSAPSGSGGKRVLITAEAAERALPSLMGMGINLTEKMDGHKPTAKIGIITEAHIEADALRIGGFIYSSDHPAEAKKILAEQAQLGFSFEARNITVKDTDADPLVVTDLYFTGASVLLKSAAAYKSTRLAAMAAMAAIGKETDDMTPEELKASMTEVMAGALAPVNTALAALQTQQTALEARVAGFGSAIEAQQALIQKIEPAAASLDKTAVAMEAAGMTDTAELMRRNAMTLRTDAAAGRAPQPFSLPGVTPLHPAAAPLVLPKFEDSDGYKAMMASIETMTKDLSAAKDLIAANATKMADMKAQTEANKPAPDRKTLAPHIGHLMAKTGLDLPEEGKMLNIAALDASMRAANMTIEQRSTLKTGLAHQGYIAFNSNPAV